MMKQNIQITFWGVRGSMATAGPKTVKYGGNTPCVEISHGKDTIICDAGTGIRPLGHELIRRSRGKTIEATILLSHLHLDHVIGLPFFKPLYKKGSQLAIICPGRDKSDLKKLLSPPYFPINILKTSLAFPHFRKKARVGGIEIQAFQTNHPDRSFAFKFHFPNGKKVVYVSDNEPSNTRRFVRWLEGTDILIHDAQYTPSQYKKKTGWGHSPYTYPLKLAMDANVKRLILFHYDPSATDGQLDRIGKKIRKLAFRNRLKVDLSREGMKIKV